MPRLLHSCRAADAGTTPAPGPWRPGTRAYLSAGLPDADWWVAGPAVAAAEDADVELDEVERLYKAHALWGSVG